MNLKNTSFLQLSFALLLSSVFVAQIGLADPNPSPLGQKMEVLAGALKSLVGSLSKIQSKPGDHSADWVNAKTQAQAMAQAAVEAKGLYPSTVAGDPNGEKDFNDTLEDLRATIQDHLIKAIDLREISDANAAVKEILQKKAAAHQKFMPPHNG